MNERLARQLGPEAKQALALAQKLAGKELVLKREPHLDGDVRAVLTRPRHEGQRYEIKFARGQERFLDHLVAHEVGHLVRLYQVPAEKRLFPIVTAASRHRAASQVVPELTPALRRGMPADIVPDLFDIWLQGVATQLTSFPADLRIEQWIHDRFPGIRKVQERSLALEVRRAMPSFLPSVAAFTPYTVYRSTMAMNATQALHVAELYGRPELVYPFEARGLGPVARKLKEMVFDARDEGHTSDIFAVNNWAWELGISGWVQWQRPHVDPGTSKEVKVR